VTAGYERFATAADLVQRASELAPSTVIIDVEPLVAWWDSGQELLDSGVASMVSQLGRLAGLSVLCFAMNSAPGPHTCGLVRPLRWCTWQLPPSRYLSRLTRACRLRVW
jgi:hypothetical protein